MIAIHLEITLKVESDGVMSISLSLFDASSLFSCVGDSEPVLLYFNQETRETWQPGKGLPTDDGVALWLPHKTIVEVQMVHASSRGGEADKQEDMTVNRPPPGVLFSFSWMFKPNTLTSIYSSPLTLFLS